MTELLLEIDEAVKEADETELYQSLYRNLRAQYCEDEALDVFDDMMRNSGKITFGKLKMMQMLVIAKFINGGTLNCAPDTNYYDKVDVEFDMKIMPEEFTYEEYFIRGWAVINRSIEWKEDIVVPDYSCVGLFFNQRWDKLSDWNLKQVFLLDTILAKIHQKMVELKPELGKYLPNTSDESLEGTNYFAIYINLLKMFEEPWFKEFRSDKKYSLKWIEKFLDNLLRSEWRDEIADEWISQIKASANYSIENILEAERNTEFGRVGLFDEDEILIKIEKKLDKGEGVSDIDVTKLKAAIEMRRSVIAEKMKNVSL
jgi:hypothetical protein